MTKLSKSQVDQLRVREYSELIDLLDSPVAPWDEAKKRRCVDLGRKFGLRIEWERIDLNPPDDKKEEAEKDEQKKRSKNRRTNQQVQSGPTLYD